MPRCCRGDLPPKIEPGRHIDTSGSGTPQDPLILSATTALEVTDNRLFNLILDGDGTLESPWRLQIAYGSGHQLDDLPDVATGTDPANGYVMTWDKPAQKWVAGPPTTAAAGAVLNGDGIVGDGSAGGPLEAEGNAARYIQVDAAGIGLTDNGIAGLIRPYATAAERTAAGVPTTATAFSILATRPDVIDRWDGSAWVPVTGGRSTDIQPGQLLSLSGAYAGGSTVTYVAQLSFTTDSTGAFVVIPSGDLTGYSGVLDAVVQERGSIPWKCMVAAGVSSITGKAYRVDTGAAYANTTLTATVRALLY